MPKPKSPINVPPPWCSLHNMSADMPHGGCSRCERDQKISFYVLTIVFGAMITVWISVIAYVLWKL